jgi:hypothetical protein
VLDGREHGGRLTTAGNGDHCMMPPFVVDRRQILDPGMATARIVEAFDELEDRSSRFGLRSKATATEKLTFERGKEALRLRVMEWTPPAFAPLDGQCRRAGGNGTCRCWRSIWPSCRFIFMV